MSASLTPTASLPPSDYIIIGGTGDLSLRKIFPAFFWHYLDSQLTDEYRLFATSRATLSVAEFAEKLRPFCESAFADGHATADKWESFLKIIQNRLPESSLRIGQQSIIWRSRQACLGRLY